MSNGDRVTEQVKALIEAASQACRDSDDAGNGILSAGPGYMVRRISLSKNEEVPFSRALDRTKTWAVLSGRGHADIGEVEREFSASDVCIIPPGYLHQIENRDVEPLVLIETSVMMEHMSLTAASARAT